MLGTILQILQQLREKTTVNASTKGLQNKDIPALIAAIQSNPKLTTINFSGNSFYEGKDFDNLIAACVQHPTLQSVDFSDNKSYVRSEHQVESISDYSLVLAQVNFYREISQQVQEYVKKLLANKSKLREQLQTFKQEFTSLEHACKESNPDWITIFKKAQQVFNEMERIKSQSPQHAYHESLMVSPEQESKYMGYMADMISYSPELDTLSFVGCHLDASFAPVLLALEKHSKLKSLDLSGINLNPDDFERILKIKNLQSLKIQSEFTEKHFDILIAALERNISLSTLNIGATKLTEKQYQQLEQTLRKNNGNLTNLMISNNNITNIRKNLSNLQKIIKRNKEGGYNQYLALQKRIEESCKEISTDKTPSTIKQLITDITTSSTLLEKELLDSLLKKLEQVADDILIVISGTKIPDPTSLEKIICVCKILEKLREKEIQDKLRQYLSEKFAQHDQHFFTFLTKISIPLIRSLKKDHKDFAAIVEILHDISSRNTEGSQLLNAEIGKLNAQHFLNKANAAFADAQKQDTKDAAVTLSQIAKKFTCVIKASPTNTICKVNRDAFEKSLKFLDSKTLLTYSDEELGLTIVENPDGLIYDFKQLYFSACSQYLQSRSGTLENLNSFSTILKSLQQYDGYPPEANGYFFARVEEVVREVLRSMSDTGSETTSSSVTKLFQSPRISKDQSLQKLREVKDTQELRELILSVNNAKRVILGKNPEYVEQLAQILKTMKDLLDGRTIVYPVDKATDSKENEATRRVTWTLAPTTTVTKQQEPKQTAKSNKQEKPEDDEVDDGFVLLPSPTTTKKQELAHTINKDTTQPLPADNDDDNEPVELKELNKPNP